MITALMTFFLMISGSPHQMNDSDHMSSAPQIRCEIAMASWCIAAPGYISMMDLPNDRLWRVWVPMDMKAGPLMIMASKSCSDRAGDKVVFAGQMEKTNMYGWKDMHSAMFKIGENGCELKFLWPSGPNDSFYYIQFMLYHVLVGEHKKELLYKFYNKVRCNGRFVAFEKCPYKELKKQ